MSGRSSRKNPPLATTESPRVTSSESTEDFNPRAADDDIQTSPKRNNGSKKSSRKATPKSDDEEDVEIESKPDSVAVDLQAHSRRSRKRPAEPEITTAAQEDSEDSSDGPKPKTGAPRGSAASSSISKPEELAYEDEMEPRTTKEKIVWRLRYCLWGLFETLSSSYLNVFLALAPFVYLSVAFNWPQEAVFLLDILAIMSHAAMMVRLFFVFFFLVFWQGPQVFLPCLSNRGYPFFNFLVWSSIVPFGPISFGLQSAPIFFDFSLCTHLLFVFAQFNDVEICMDDGRQRVDSSCGREIRSYGFPQRPSPHPGNIRYVSKTGGQFNLVFGYQILLLLS
jgi:hypothetical protein